MHTRFIASAVTALTAFFLFATPALANTTNLSTDPSYAGQPFSYYCQPYKYSFVSGKHYVVASNPPCIFSVPSDVTGIKTIALYKGVPGNATGVAADQVTGAIDPTLVQENSTVFVSPAQDQDYFAVVYGYASPPEAAQFDAAFRT